MNFGFVIPVYRHGSTLEAVVKSLLAFNYPIIVVDDGNDEANRAFISEITKPKFIIMPKLPLILQMNLMNTLFLQPVHLPY